MDILSQFISVLCHSDWLFHGESCPCLDVHPGRLWSSALCLSPGNSLVSSWCDHSMLASLLWRCFHLKGVKSCYFILSECPAFTTICCYSTGHTSTFISHKIAPSHLQKTDIIFLWANDLRSYIYTHTHPFNGPLSGTTRVSQYQKGKTSLDFTEARDSEWQ